jgi:hypothetical protein
MTYSYKKDSNVQLSPHFKVGEFRCKDGSDKIIIDLKLITLLERLRDKLGCSSINITSGYRTPSHSVKVGGYKTDNHTKGMAADIVCIKDGKRINAKYVCCAAQDLGIKGIGYINSTSTHIDTRTKKWYGDETKNINTIISFYDYFNVPRPSVPVVKKYGITTVANLRIRKSASLSSRTIVQVKKGTKLEIVGRSGKFYKVIYNGSVAYSWASYIKIL